MTARQVGGSPDSACSSEERERLKGRAGERLPDMNAMEDEEVLTPVDPVLGEVTRIYHRGAGKYRNALRELAK